MVEEVAPSAFISAIEGAVAQYVSVWQERPEAENTAQR